MRIVLAHNFYKVSGGEDTVFANEASMLKANGHEVILFSKNNEGINSFWVKFITFFSCIFSVKTYREFSDFLDKNQPDVVHVHNYFPLISPSIFYCCFFKNVPVVHTLHNFRAICPTAILAFKGRINERSVRGSAFWTVIDRVYKNSYFGSFSLYAMVSFHKKFRTWQRCVTRFICLTEFSKQKYIEAGWPSEKLSVKPNFVNYPGTPKHSGKKGAIYVGRLSEEKGIQILLDAWNNISYPLTVVGDGPLKEAILKQSNPNVHYVGFKNSSEVIQLLESAAFIVMPSTCYEGLPMVLIEAFSVGTPAIVSNIGGMKEVVQDKYSGLHFNVAESEDLFRQVNKLIADPQLLVTLSEGAKQSYFNNYDEKSNYCTLMNIYQLAINECKRLNNE